MPDLRLPAKDATPAFKLVSGIMPRVPALPTRVALRWMWNVTAWLVQLDSYVPRAGFAESDAREGWQQWLEQEYKALSTRPLVVPLSGALSSSSEVPEIPGALHSEWLGYQALSAYQHFAVALRDNDQVWLYHDGKHPADLLRSTLRSLQVQQVENVAAQRLGIWLNRVFPVFAPSSVWETSLACCRLYVRRHPLSLGMLERTINEEEDWVSSSNNFLVDYHRAAAQQLGNEEGSYDWRVLNTVLAEVILAAWSHARKKTGIGSACWRIRQGELLVRSAFTAASQPRQNQLEARVPYGQVLPMPPLRRHQP